MSSFQERQKSLFDHLFEAEKQHKKSTNNCNEISSDSGEIDKQTYRRIKSTMKHFRGRESIFKRPDAPIGKCLRSKTVPDHIKNPKKWVHYSLADVTSEQMSDATNTATALALIRELEEREINKVDVNEDDTFKKPTFYLSATVKKGIKSGDNKITFKSSKVIMPEYVVGASDNKKNKDKNIKNKLIKKDLVAGESVKKVELKLQHLYEED